MAKFISLPVEIEAEQYLGFYTQWPPGLQIEEGSFGPFVVTAHGQKTKVEVDDWVIAEPDGRGYYPCKQDIFAKRWKPIPAEMEDAGKPL